jgi:hypothetical protein
MSHTNWGLIESVSVSNLVAQERIFIDASGPQGDAHALFASGTQVI